MASLVLICALGALAGLIFAVSGFMCVGFIATMVITRVRYWAIQKQREKASKDSVFTWKKEANHRPISTSPDIGAKQLHDRAAQSLVDNVPSFIGMKGLSNETQKETKAKVEVPKAQSPFPALTPDPVPAAASTPVDSKQDEQMNKSGPEEQSLLDVLADLPNIATVTKRQVSKSLEVERMRETSEDEVLIEIVDTGDRMATEVDISARKRSRRISLDWLPAPPKNPSSSQMELLSDVDEGSDDAEGRDLDIEEGQIRVDTEHDVMAGPENGLESPTFDMRLRDPRVKQIFDSYDYGDDAESQQSNGYTSVLSFRFHGRDSHDSVDSSSGLLGRVDRQVRAQEKSTSSNEYNDDDETISRVPSRRTAKRMSMVRAECLENESQRSASSKSEAAETADKLRKKKKAPKLNYVTQESFGSVSSGVPVSSSPVEKVQKMERTMSGRSAHGTRTSDVSSVGSKQKLKRAVRTISAMSAASDESIARIPGTLVRPTKKKSSSPPNSSPPKLSPQKRTVSRSSSSTSLTSQSTTGDPRVKGRASRVEEKVLYS